MNLSKQTLCLLFILFLSSCKVYKQNIILKSEDSVDKELLSKEIQALNGSYPIKPGDKLSIEVYSDQGERIIDPFNVIAEGGNVQARPENTFQVFPDSSLHLPLIGQIKVNENETINSFQDRLKELYQSVYINPFVRVTAVNRRVIVLGALGGQVIPLENESMNLLEVLALAGGLNNQSKGTNIRLIRNPTQEPIVHIIDLSTIDGMKKANLEVQPGDVIYVEPIRRVFNESFRDAAPVIGVVTNLITLIIITQNLF